MDPGTQAQISPTQYIHWSGTTKLEANPLGGRAPPEDHFKYSGV